MGTFPNTRWSIVVLAANEDGAGARRAFAQLFEAYWYPLFAHLRARGHARHEAEDLLQGFFVHLCERQTLTRADRLKGSFRSFVLGCLRFFLANQRESDQATKRGGGAVPISFDFDAAEQRLADDTAAYDDIDKSFDHRWAIQLMRLATDELKAEYADRPDVFAELKGFLTVGDDTPYADVAARLGMSVAAVKTTVHRMRRQLRDILRRRVAVTVDAPHEIDDELRYLIGVLAG